MDEHDTTLRGEHLGDELRKLRGEAKLTLMEAAGYISASVPKLSKMERGKYGFQFEDVAGLLSVYRVVGQRRHELLAMAREADQRGWILRADHDEAVRTLRRIESTATEIVNYEPSMIPGLLQTVPYTLAVFRQVVGASAEQANVWMANRLKRQSVLQYPCPVFTALISEDALRHSVGGSAVLGEQLRYLVEAGERPKIAIRIVPNSEEGHPGLDGPFLQYQVPGRCGVVCLENRTFSIFLEEKADIRHYDGITEHLLAIALSERDSAELIASIAAELEGDPGR